MKEQGKTTETKSIQGKSTETTPAQVKTGKTRMNIRYMTVTAMLSALAFILQFFEFSIPALIPPFIKMDLSDLPELIGSFAMGPLYGVLICLIKNLLHLFVTSTGGVGELSNFLLGAVFVLPAGLIYQKKKTKKRAICGAVLGAAAMALFSIAANYYIVYPVYTAFMPMDTIIAAYQQIMPSIPDGGLLQCLIVFNAPFTFVKGMLSVIITVLVYKHLSPIIKGTNR